MSEEALAWLTPEIIRKVVGGPAREYDAKPLGAGDNFASSALKVKVTTEKGDVHHFIVKRPLPADVVQVFYPAREAFDVEGRVYREILPVVGDLLKSIGREHPLIAPRMAYQQPEPAPLLFFEDISVDGFRLAGRDSSLDAAHVRLVLRSLARWHAATSVLLHQHPETFDNMPRMVCEEHDKFVDGLLVKGFARFLKHAEQWPEELSRRVVAKLKKLQPDCRQRILDAYRPDPLGQAFNVGLHGDLWTGNVLFKYDADGKPVDVRLIDFQITTWGSPCSDLMYFFPAVGGEARLARDQMLAEYHTELAACLGALGAQRVPTLADLQADMRRRAMIEVMHLSAGTAFIMAPHSLGLSFANLMDLHEGDGPHPRDLAMQMEPFKRVAATFFAAWEKEGLLDALL